MSAFLTREVAIGCDRMGCISEVTFRVRSRSVDDAFFEARAQSCANGWENRPEDVDVCPSCVAADSVNWEPAGYLHQVTCAACGLTAKNTLVARRAGWTFDGSAHYCLSCKGGGRT